MPAVHREEQVLLVGEVLVDGAARVTRPSRRSRRGTRPRSPSRANTSSAASRSRSRVLLAPPLLGPPLGHASMVPLPSHSALTLRYRVRILVTCPVPSRSDRGRGASARATAPARSCGASTSPSTGARSSPCSGPNGAGKTTTVEILEGYRDGRRRGRCGCSASIPPTHPAELRERTGVVLQECGFPNHLRVGELVDAWRGLYPAPRPLDELLELVELADRARPAASGGCPAGSAGASTSRWRSPATRTLDLPRRAHHRLRPRGAAALLGRHREPALRSARRSCSPPTTSTRPSGWPTGSRSWPTGASGPSAPAASSPRSPVRRPPSPTRLRR